MSLSFATWILLLRVALRWHIWELPCTKLPKTSLFMLPKLFWRRLSKSSTV
ncbi:uncharacterized protein DS421_15g507710 [Arachis hypogaea]|nr:uncharacterized protein DS421_15g507710 [Arachis hypogaea]